jgi:hypothetical protein
VNSEQGRCSVEARPKVSVPTQAKATARIALKQPFYRDEEPSLGAEVPEPSDDFSLDPAGVPSELTCSVQPVMLRMTISNIAANKYPFEHWHGLHISFFQSENNV